MAIAMGYMAITMNYNGQQWTNYNGLQKKMVFSLGIIVVHVIDMKSIVVCPILS